MRRRRRQSVRRSPATPVFYGGRNVLESVARLGRRAKQRFAAVAYVSDATLFPFKAGDVLVVDMGRRALAQGNTNPWKLEQLLESKVRLFDCPGLHAKVFVFGDYVAVGSANLSTTSRTNEEAVLCVRGNEQLRQEVLNRIREWARPDQQITPGRIEDAKKHYRRPEGGGGQALPRKPPPRPIWLVRVEHGPPPKKLRPQISEAERRVREGLAQPLEYEPRTARGFARDTLFRAAKKGDWMVEVFRPTRGPTEVCPPARLARREGVNVRDVDGAKYIYTVEVRKDQVPVSLARFRRMLKGQASPTVSTSSGSGPDAASTRSGACGRRRHSASTAGGRSSAWSSSAATTCPERPYAIGWSRSPSRGQRYHDDVRCRLLGSVGWRPTNPKGWLLQPLPWRT